MPSPTQRAKTDSAQGLEFGNPERPEADNLLTMYQLMSGLTRVSLPGGFQLGDPD